MCILFAMEKRGPLVLDRGLWPRGWAVKLFIVTWYIFSDLWHVHELWRRKIFNSVCLAFVFNKWMIGDAGLGSHSGGWGIVSRQSAGIYWPRASEANKVGWSNLVWSSDEADWNYGRKNAVACISESCARSWLGLVAFSDWFRWHDCVVLRRDAWLSDLYRTARCVKCYPNIRCVAVVEVSFWTYEFCRLVHRLLKQMLARDSIKFMQISEHFWPLLFLSLC